MIIDHSQTGKSYDLMELPIDILPEILVFIVHPAHLVSTCLVNKTFYRCSIRLLYGRIAMHPWLKNVKNKVIQLFITLSGHPEIAQLVHHLELRDFPIYHPYDPVVVKALQLCTNLRSCIWTRHGSLSSNILRAIASCPELRELEISSDGNYDHTLLLKFRNLVKLSILMTTVNLASQLHDCLALNVRSLRSLTLICRARPLITSDLLKSIAPLLSHLDHFHISGCYKLDNHGLWALISTNKRGLLTLGLEGLSPHFDIQALSLSCASRTPHPLRRLRSVSLSIPAFSSATASTLEMVVCESFSNLLASSPLEKIHISSTTMCESGTEVLLRHINERHAKTLRCLSIRCATNLDRVQVICKSCHILEELFLVVTFLPNDVEKLAAALSPSRSLRKIHVNNPNILVASQAQFLPCILLMLEQCSPTITQFGWNSDVWEVKRKYENGVSLVKCENPLDVPEGFLVVRP